MHTLIANPGQPDERSFAIGNEPVTLGRGEDQAVSIQHPSLSRSHARMEPAGGLCWVVDLQSRNGTFVNGVRVQRQELRPGDTVMAGDVVFLFLSEPALGDRPGDGPEPPAAAPARGPGASAAARPTLVHPLTRVPLATLLQARAAEGRPRGSDARLGILIEVAKLLPVSNDLDALLGKILDLAFQILDADRGVVLLVDEATGRLSPRVAKTARGAPPSGPIHSQTIVDHVFRESVAALFADTALDGRLATAQSIAAQSIRASLCAPLKPREGVIGVLYVDNLSGPHRFTEADLELFVAFASQAAIAVENASLYRRLEREASQRLQLILDAKLAALVSLTAGIAHQIRNPLNFMTSFAELSAEAAEDLAAILETDRKSLPADTRDAIDQALTSLQENTARITEHGRRASAVVQGMTEHARRTSGARAVAELNALVAQAVVLAREWPQLGDLQVSVREAYDPEVGTLEVATQDLFRVFLNVIENALQAMQEKRRERGAAYAPELHVRTEGRGDTVEVRFLDNGVGMPAAVVDRIFEPFFTTRPTGQGTGLGLSLSHDIVVQGHQGSIRAASDPGERTEIVIALPRRPGSRPDRAPTRPG